MNQDIKIRKSNNDDFSYILVSWARHFKFSSIFARKISPAIYFSNHHKVIKKILNRKTTHVLIAHLPDDPDVIIGYLVYEGVESRPTIHMIYVKRAFRKFGVATELLNGFRLRNAMFTHWTNDLKWIKQKAVSLQFNPYLAIF